jgi:hypothetical protein
MAGINGALALPVSLSFPHPWPGVVMGTPITEPARRHQALGYPINRGLWMGGPRRRLENRQTPQI